MTVKSQYICDGCDEARLRGDGDGKPEDWARVNIRVEGLNEGYPGAGKWANGDKTYDLCPHCQRRLADSVRPNAWPRAEKADSA